MQMGLAFSGLLVVGIMAMLMYELFSFVEKAHHRLGAPRKSGVTPRAACGVSPQGATPAARRSRFRGVPGSCTSLHRTCTSHEP